MGSADVWQQLSDLMACLQRLNMLRRAGLPGSFQRADSPRQANGYDCGVYVLGEYLACLTLHWGVDRFLFGISAGSMMSAKGLDPADASTQCWTVWSFPSCDTCGMRRFHLLACLCWCNTVEHSCIAQR